MDPQNFPSIRVSNLRWQLAQAAEKIWWRRYLRRRPAQEYTHWKRGYWHTFLNDIRVSPPHSAKVLDAGCGPAGIFILLSFSCQVTAADPLLPAYQGFKGLELTNNPSVRFCPTTLEELPLDQRYDYVFCLNVINHVQDMAKSLRRLYRATRPGGQFVVSVDAHRYPLLKPLFKSIPGDVLHPHQLVVSEYEQLLRTTGFQIERSYLYRQEFLFDYWVFVCQRPES